MVQNVNSASFFRNIKEILGNTDKMVKKGELREHFFSTSFYIWHLPINFPLETRHFAGDEKKLLILYPNVLLPAILTYCMNVCCHSKYNRKLQRLNIRSVEQEQIWADICWSPFHDQNYRNILAYKSSWHTAISNSVEPNRNWPTEILEPQNNLFWK